MAKADELAAAAEKAAAKKIKPLPELRSPMTRLPEEIRKVIAVLCRDTGESFSLKTVKMWIAKLKEMKLIPADMKIELAVKRVGSGPLREKLTASEAKVAELEAELAKLKAKR